MLAGMRRNDRREADESAQHLLLGGGPVEQVVEQRITYERTCVRTQGGRNRIVREIIQDRAQRQAAAAEKNKNEQLDEDDTEIAEAAGRVLASLGAQRSMLGLATPSPTKADRKAIIGLYRRLVDQGAQWPTLVMVDAIGFAMNGDWWPKRIRTGRALARHWDELNDDMILAAGRTDGDAHAQTVPPAESTEPDAAPWLPDWAVKTLAELDGQDATAGGEATA